jgi:TRAP-type uncharacterized transport system substrate-binding protein
MRRQRRARGANTIRLRIDREILATPLGLVLIAATLIVVLATVFAALRPLPPREIAIATGPAGSTYQRSAERYRQILARDGVRLRLIPTNGAVDNVRALRDPKSGVGAGFVQAGSVTAADTQDLQSLGTLFYEPLWLFCRCPEALTPAHLPSGWRISIGPEGSADRPLALKLLSLNGIDISQLHALDYPPEEAARALLAGQLDALVLLSGWDSPLVRELARAPDIKLAGFPRADAYVALNPYLSKFILPRGVADLAADRPPQDTPLIASKASLAVRKDLHPAIQYLLLRAAVEVHSGPGMFQRAGEFPAPEAIDLPISEQARNFYRSGPTYLQRTLPFWLAELVQRLLILIVPLIGIVYPLWSLAPRVYSWTQRRRLYPLHRELKRLEQQVRAGSAGPVATMKAQLDALDARTFELQLPPGLSDSLYTLRGRIDALRQALAART